MKEYKLHNVLITPPQEVSSKLKAIHQHSVAKFGNTYFTEDYKPHLAIFTIALTEIESINFSARVEKVFNEFKINETKIKLSSVSSEGKYIFVELDESCNKLLTDLNQKFKLEFNELFIKNALNFFDTRMIPLTNEERELISKTGSKYEFKPHFTLGKFEIDKVEAAFKDISAKFVPLEFTFDKVELSKERVESGFDVLGEIEIRNL